MTPMPAQVTQLDIETASSVLRDQIALVEGNEWKAKDENDSLDMAHGSTHAAVQRFIRNRVDGFPLVIYGRDVSRYFIEEGGVVVFSEGHNRALADKARAYKFEVR